MKSLTSDPGIGHFRFMAVLIAVIFVVSMRDGFAQQSMTANATDFTSVEYYPAPAQTQMKSRLSGAQASPMPGGLLVIKQFKLEMFNTNGEPQVIVRAPECTYDAENGEANSSGPLYLQNGDGKIRTQGVGFLWRRADSFLLISNDVKTVAEGPATVRER